MVEHGLSEIKLPSLTRPPVLDTNPDEKLVRWGITYYSYSVIAHMQTILRGLSQLLKAENVPTAFIVCRHVFEWTAHTCYMSRNLKNYVEREEWGRAWHLQSLAMQGNRWIKDHGPKYGPEAIMNGIPDPLGIANIVACYEEYRRQQYGRPDAKDSYGLLSEHSHPNSACFNPYCKFVGWEVRFVPPSPDSSLLGEERCLIDLMLFIETLLGLGNEKTVRSQVIATLTRIGDLAQAMGISDNSTPDA
jgi:hypothetical protein